MTTPQVLGERYEIGGVLGRGGMAEVHRGRDLRLGREVAVKVLRSDLARDPSFQVRFRREAQAAASLNHPAIVAVYDTGEDRTANGATPYIVMEYVEGETLRDVLRREGVLSPERAMTFAADICAALDFSHRNGIVHRDVKPGNVMVTPEGSVKVMDFGIARAVSDSAATMTSTAAVIGTAQYLSPEQARGESVDARSDVYSAGCLLYELVTGAPPFTGDSPVSVAYQHVREDPRLPSSINPAIPPDLDAILLKALSKNPANRYQSAAEMRNDLLRGLAGQRVEATPVMGDAERTAIIGAPAPGYGGEDWPGENGAPHKKRNRVIAAVAAAIVLIGGVVALALVLGSGNDDEPAAVAQVTVPTLVGLQQTAAEAALGDAGLKVGDVSTRPTDDDTRVGTVLESTPASGAQVDRGTAVALVVGVGPDTVRVPPVVNLAKDDARTALENAGFTRISTDSVDSTKPQGTVVAVDPKQGSDVAPDTAVTLSISDGDAAVTDVVGQEQGAARQALLAAGFTNITVDEIESDQPAGTVVATDPAAGTQAAADEQITLQVSSGSTGPTAVEVPDVVGESSSAARQALQGAGFTVTVREVPAGDPGDVDVVLSTDPAAGSQAARGSQVTIAVGVAPAGQTASPTPSENAGTGGLSPTG